MRSRIALAIWTLAVSLLIGCHCRAVHQVRPRVTSNPYINPEWILSEEEVVKLGDCRITVSRAYFWRDWMPIVSHPGPDGGSPLRAKISFWVDNSKGQKVQMALNAVAVDHKGQRYPLNIHILPNYLLLPDDVAKAFKGFDEPAKKRAIAKYRVMWDSVLYAGETRAVEVAGSDGPFLPAGSAVRVDVTWTDAKGRSAVVPTPLQQITRTD